MSAQFFQINIRFMQRFQWFSRLDRNDQAFLKVEYRILHPFCHYKTLRLGEALRVFQHPDQENLSFDKYW